MLHCAQGVSARILWANLHLLFWLSLMWIVPDRRIERVVKTK